MPGTGKKGSKQRANLQRLGHFKLGIAEGEPSTLTLFRGLFYSWPVAPQQSRLRFKQPPNLGSFSLLFLLMALVKSLVQRLNERLLGGRVNAPYCAVVGARKVRLAGPSQLGAVMQVERGPGSGTTYVSCWPHLDDLLNRDERGGDILKS